MIFFQRCEKNFVINMIQVAHETNNKYYRIYIEKGWSL